ncbi:hypothetical protein NGF19_01240 [Streptomyces sp. RY43-2]|uniref:ABC transporter permease n=1 Tax=Streptomyces macrolidinus TaxID=2952607 RepID=A0ABT0Z6M9_9ACTN|nr:hypothetical protein [Streptomyces macrolidinus]MCN9239420.1 hypothetical protein [Streptomyces macrolidinus]
MTLLAEKRPHRPARRHPLRAEALHGFGPWAGAALLLTCSVLLAGASARWQGGWAETGAELHDVLLIGVPLAAAIGCLQGGREHRRHTEELWRTAVRGPLARFLASALPVALWVAAGYVLAAAGALLATWPYARGDRPHLALLPADAVVLAASAVAGQVVGRLTAWRPMAPLLAIAGYVALGIPRAAAGPGAGGRLNPAFPVPDAMDPVWWQPVAMAVWGAGLAATAVLAYAARRRYTALLPLAAATIAGALLVHTGEGLWHENPLARRQVCDTSTTPQICVNARYGEVLPQVTEALSEVTGRLEGVRNLPVRFEDHAGAPHRDEVELPMLTPLGWYLVRGRLTDPEQYAWEAVSQLEGRGECERVDARVARADDAVQYYLAPSPSQKDFDAQDAQGDRAARADLKARLAARAHLASMGEKERRAWLSAYFASTGRCDPKGVPSL